ncbi:MAG: hypothetical protein CYPHOPRED_005358 [Cyphobasidiales sp. Tagirdzhanova-0007]|nr:MAG: hypothetical protein CYPHOPRED_005358 [Cyphobasidiales sp. Tagirdzhanova-0007]
MTANTGAEMTTLVSMQEQPVVALNIMPKPDKGKSNGGISRTSKRVKLNPSRDDRKEISSSSSVFESTPTVTQYSSVTELPPAPDSESEDELETTRMMSQMLAPPSGIVKADQRLTHREEEDEAEQQAEQILLEEEEGEKVQKRLFLSSTVDEYSAPPHSQFVRSVFVM